MKPRATVIGVRSSWEANRTNRRWRSRAWRSLWASRRASAAAAILRRTCQTMTRKSSAINGISVVSSQPITPLRARSTSGTPVTTVTARQVSHISRSDQGRSP